MKKAVGKIVGFAILVALVALVVTLLVLSGRTLRTVACGGMDVEYFPQSCGLTDADGIRGLVIGKYGLFVGQRADSVGLNRIEKILDAEGAVKKSQVYITGDGMLHARITEREPRIRFIAGGTVWYTDADGVVFRAPGEFNGEVPTASGRPLEGEPEWVKGMLKVASYVSASEGRGISISGIEVLPDGSILIKAADGNGEKFIFGKPTENPEAKFRRIDRYYRDIRGAAGYRTVDIRYRGQIICKK